MKKIVCFIIAVIVIFFCISVFAASTVTQSDKNFSDGKITEITLDVVAHTDGTVTSWAFTDALNAKVIGKLLCQIETDPGTTAPTTLYDITLTDISSNDVLGGAGMNRSATATEPAVPIIDTTTSLQGCRTITSPLTFNLSNNSVNGAIVSVKLLFVKP
jgi:hypothetical protein